MSWSFPPRITRVKKEHIQGVTVHDKIDQLISNNSVSPLCYCRLWDRDAPARAIVQKKGNNKFFLVCGKPRGQWCGFQCECQTNILLVGAYIPCQLISTKSAQSGSLIRVRRAESVDGTTQHTRLRAPSTLTLVPTSSQPENSRDSSTKLCRPYRQSFTMRGTRVMA